MSTAIYPWQQAAWEQLHSLGGKLPHAILFHGAAGTGKTDFIECYAQSLLCENVNSNGHACGACASCGWFGQHSHPDYRRVRPEAFEDEGAGDSEEDPETGKKTKSTKAPSKEIKIEQIRNLADFMNISTHRRGLRVVVLYPAEALNVHASNALLKTLEEPPPGTVFLLSSNSLDRLLPTILSRCRKFALPMPDSGASLSWLTSQGLDDAEHYLREQGGAPLAALAHASSEYRDEIDALLQFLSRPTLEKALAAADKVSKAPLVPIVSGLQRWLYDVFSYKLSGNIRYYPRYTKELAALADKMPTSALLGVIARTNQRRTVASHPLSAKLFVEDMLIDYTGCCN